jgi:putative lipase involved disintegration of autophagic bodies
MATQLNEYEFVSHGRPHRYDWTSWSNGKPWKLTQGEDFTVSTQGMRGNIYSYAKANKMKAQTSITDEGKTIVVLLTKATTKKVAATI